MNKFPQIKKGDIITIERLRVTKKGKYKKCKKGKETKLIVGEAYKGK